VLKTVRFGAFRETKDAAAIYFLQYFNVKDMIPHIIYFHKIGSNNWPTSPQELVNRTSHRPWMRVWLEPPKPLVTSSLDRSSRHVFWVIDVKVDFNVYDIHRDP